MKIIGTEPNSSIEWPGKLSYVIFIAGCNFRCPMCSDRNLVLPEKYTDAPEIKQEDIVSELEERLRFIDAVCITGGEPTIHGSDLFSFLTKIRELNSHLLIRIETNGSNPSFLEKLIKNELIDSIAFDIKNPKRKYSEVCGVDFDADKITETLSLIKSTYKGHLLKDYELRTTLVPGVHELDDVVEIAGWIHYTRPPSSKKEKIPCYVLQQFRTDLPAQVTLDLEYLSRGNYPYKKCLK
jgi:pyruvate formate lyase activating enzyme